MVPQVLPPAVAGMAPGPELAGLLDGVDVTELGAFELVEATAAWQRIASWAKSAQAGVLTELIQRRQMRPPSDTGYRSVNPVTNTAMDIAGRTCTTTRQAENTVGYAVQLVEDFPATHAALGAGMIDERRARVITTELGGQDPAIRRRVEAAVLPDAGEMDSVVLRRKVKRLLHQLAPVETEQRCQQARQRRYVRDSPAEDGMAHLEAYLPAEDITAVMTTLNAAADTAKRRDRTTGHPPRTADQRRADALAELAWNSITTGHLAPHPTSGASDTGSRRDSNDTDDGDHAAGRGRDNYHGEDGGGGCNARRGSPDADTGKTASTGSRRNDQSSPDRDVRRAVPPGGGVPVGTALASAHGRPVAVHVTIPLTTLLGLDEHPAHLDGYGPIPAHTGRHLAATGIWDWLGTHPTTGEILNYGRSRYRPPQALIDYVILRDRECRAPGCHHPAIRCDIDHRHPYNQGGPTSACNCLPLCETHHLLKHHGQWRLTRLPSGAHEWISPSGHRYTKPPEQIGPTPPRPTRLKPPAPPTTPNTTATPADTPAPPDPGDDIPPF